MSVYRPLHKRARTTTIATLLALGVLTACADEPTIARAAADPADADFPVEVTSCGHTTTLTAPPERAVTLNQGATEVALALGVADQMAGTAYLDDAVPEKWRADYDSIEVLSAEYPPREDLIAAEPDFVYASYSSAFDAKVAGSAAELARSGIGAYLSPFGCADAADRPEPSFEAVWAEVDSIADAFGVSERAEAVRAEQSEALDALAEDAAGDGIRVFWYDSGEDTAFAGVGEGGPQLVLDAVGATNVFADLEGSWADVNWEKVVAADPDVIVFADAAWSTTQEKIDHLENDPVLSQLRAVQGRQYATVAFSESTAGVRLVDGAVKLADQLAALTAQQ